MTRKAMVLGGTGFLGRHICAAFLTAGYRVVCVSREGEWPGPADDGLSLVHLDLDAAGDEFTKLLTTEAPRGVVNAAGVVWRSTRSAEDRMWALHAHFVDRLVHAMAASEVPARLVQMGSAHEYGPSAPGTSTTEDEPPAPRSVYGNTKLVGTRTVLQAARTLKVQAVVLRVANVIGPGAPQVSLVGTVAHRLAAVGAADPVELSLAPLRDWRDFVDVRDVAAAVLTAADPARDLTGGIINIARGEAVPVRRLVDILVTLSHRPVRLLEQQVAGPDRTGRADLGWQQLDISLARRLLDWQPAVSLEASLADLLATVHRDARREPARSTDSGRQEPPCES
jgi:nucleoside-diphosphate-sugar epimerase